MASRLQSSEADQADVEFWARMSDENTDIATSTAVVQRQMDREIAQLGSQLSILDRDTHRLYTLRSRLDQVLVNVEKNIEQISVDILLRKSKLERARELIATTDMTSLTCAFAKLSISKSTERANILHRLASLPEELIVRVSRYLVDSHFHTSEVSLISSVNALVRSIVGNDQKLIRIFTEQYLRYSRFLIRSPLDGSSLPSFLAHVRHIQIDLLDLSRSSGLPGSTTYSLRREFLGMKLPDLRSLTVIIDLRRIDGYNSKSGLYWNFPGDELKLRQFGVKLTFRIDLDGLGREVRALGSDSSQFSMMKQQVLEHFMNGINHKDVRDSLRTLQHALTHIPAAHQQQHHESD